jgi:hypothetical protein
MSTVQVDESIVGGYGRGMWDHAFAHLTAEGREILDEVQERGAGAVAAAVAAGKEAVAAAGAVGDKVSHDMLENAESFGDVKTRLSESESRLLSTAAAQTALTQVSLTGGFKDTQIGFKESQGLGYQNTAQIVSTVNSRAAEAAVAAVGFAKDALIDSTKNAAATALAAATNTAAILAAQERCCCELKERIREDGEKSRDLINSIKQADDARRLQQAYDEITYLKGKLVPGTPV